MQVNAGALYTAIEFAAVLASAVSGLIEARQKKLDVLGTFVVAFLTAFGGGTLRDVLLDRRRCRDRDIRSPHAHPEARGRAAAVMPLFDRPWRLSGRW